MELAHKAGARATYLNQIRGLKTFIIPPGGRRFPLYQLWTATDAQMAWMECALGTYRLPGALFPWAAVIEERAAELGFPDPWPCDVEFTVKQRGAIEVEIFPEGYESPHE